MHLIPIRLVRQIVRDARQLWFREICREIDAYNDSCLVYSLAPELFRPPIGMPLLTVNGFSKRWGFKIMNDERHKNLVRIFAKFVCPLDQRSNLRAWAA